MSKRPHLTKAKPSDGNDAAPLDPNLQQREQAMREHAKGNPDLERSINTPRPRQPGAGPGSSVKNSQH